MTNHPITVSPELVQEWLGEYFGCTVSGKLHDSQLYLATQAARWGADQELEACCEWVEGYAECGIPLRAARRPKPPSLKEQSLALIDKIQGNKDPWDIRDLDVVRHALEQLDD